MQLLEGCVCTVDERNTADPAEVETKQKILIEIHRYNRRHSGYSFYF
jgi:hypothetical protein